MWPDPNLNFTLRRWYFALWNSSLSVACGLVLRCVLPLCSITDGAFVIAGISVHLNTGEALFLYLSVCVTGFEPQYYCTVVIYAWLVTFQTQQGSKGHCKSPACLMYCIVTRWHVDESLSVRFSCWPARFPAIFISVQQHIDVKHTDKRLFKLFAIVVFVVMNSVSKVSLKTIEFKKLVCNTGIFEAFHLLKCLL